MNYQLLDTPIGTLRLVSKDGKLARVEFQGQHQVQADDRLKSDSILETAAKQLQEYFAVKRQQFELSLEPGV